jgi:hypothetical protein
LRGIAPIVAAKTRMHLHDAAVHFACHEVRP